MAKREKRLIKQIKGLRKQKEKHETKLIEEDGRKDTTPDYWKGEIERFKKQEDKKLEKLSKLTKKKKEEIQKTIFDLV